MVKCLLRTAKRLDTQKDRANEHIWCVEVLAMKSICLQVAKCSTRTIKTRKRLPKNRFDSLEVLYIVYKYFTTCPPSSEHKLSHIRVVHHLPRKSDSRSKAPEATLVAWSFEGSPHGMKNTHEQTLKIDEHWY